MKKIIILFIVAVLLPQGVCAQKQWEQVFRAATCSAGAKMFRPLSNASIERLVARGHSGLVLRRALGVTVQRNYPAASILKDGELNRVLLRQAWKEMAVNKYRWEEGNTLGLNTWLIVLAHRIREGIKVNPDILKIMEQELNLAQQDAEREFIKRYQYVRFAPDYQDNPAFLDLLGESVAQRLETRVLPRLSTADRVRFLQVLMRGVFASPVNWQEVHIAFLGQEIREALSACGKNMQQVEWYGEMKKAMRECSRHTAYEAAKFNITSVNKLREMFIEDLREASPRFTADPNVYKEWNMLIKFLENKQKNRIYTP